MILRDCCFGGVYERAGDGGQGNMGWVKAALAFHVERVGRKEHDG